MNSFSNFEITQEMLNGSLSVFVFILIITGNYLGELMPCRVRHELSENMLLKHTCGYLTLVFFAILTIFKTTQLNILFLSAVVYVYFLILSKTNWKIWLTVVFMLAISYFLYLYNPLPFLGMLWQYKPPTGRHDNSGISCSCIQISAQHKETHSLTHTYSLNR